MPIRSPQPSAAPLLLRPTLANPLAAHNFRPTAIRQLARRGLATEAPKQYDVVVIGGGQSLLLVLLRCRRSP